MPAPSASELIDAVNDRNEPVDTVARGNALRVGANFRTVHILVENAAGDVLLQQLPPGHERHPLLWGSSVAGYLHAGEAYEHAAHRRLAEELGLDVGLDEIGVTPVQDEGVIKFVGVFTCQADAFHVADPGHVATARFWPRQELRVEMDAHPEAFTPSLRHVLHFWENSSCRGPSGTPDAQGALVDEYRFRST